MKLQELRHTESLTILVKTILTISVKTAIIGLDAKLPQTLKIQLLQSRVM